MKKLLVFCLSFLLLGVINVYAETTYNIKYNGNGSTSGEMAMQEELLYSKTYTLSSNKFARTGYTFNGWNKKADGSGRSYANKATISKLTTKDGGTINLYAQWLLKDYTITYELNGGVNNSGNPSVYTVESGTITLKEPTKEGYAFLGWYKDSGLTSKVTKIASGSTGSKKFYAKWQKVTYSIEYNGNGNTSGEMSNKTGLKYGVAYTLNSNKFARNAYKFLNWNTKTDGSGTTYVNKDTVSNLTKKNNAVVTLYAQWKPKTYTITYELNGGKNSKENPKTYTIETPTTLLQPATRDGYTFVGWYKDSALTSKVTKVLNGTYGNRTLYAKWRPNTYTIKYNGNGAEKGEMADQTGLEYDASYKLTSNAFTRKGYVFNKWAKRADGAGTTYSNKATVSNLTKTDNGVVTMYAQWTPREYTVTYELNGGVNNPDNPTTITILTSKTLATPTKEGNTFLGWYSDSALTKRVTKISKGTTNNLKFYAKWQRPIGFEVSETNVDITKGTTKSINVNYNGSGTIYCSSDSTYVATCEWSGVWNGQDTKLKINGKNTGTATITLTNEENDNFVTIDVTVVGKKHNVYYELNGGVNNPANPSYFYERGSYIDLQDPTRYGYDFDGWYKDAALTDDVSYISPYEENDVTLYAKWRRGFVPGTIEGIGNSFTYYGYGSSVKSICRLDALTVTFKTSEYSEKIEAKYTAKLTKTYNSGTTIEYCYIVLNFYDEDNVKVGDALVSVSGLHEGDTGIESGSSYLDSDSSYVTGSVINVRTISRA